MAVKTKDNRLMRDKLLFSAVIACSMISSLCLAASWGDLGNGRYANPILDADYSDPDVIRVGDKYYMVCSDFHFIGMPVLESRDMVNWSIISQVYDSFDYPGWNEMERYAGGSWAPAIRCHDGLYYIYFCTPDEGLFMTTAKDPHGPWAPLHLVKEVKKWEDPCPFWDEDGNAYLVRSQYGAGPIILHRMSADGRELLDGGTVIYEGPVAEGPKMHKWNGKYYISLPEGGVRGGWQTILRSDSIYGPYERKVVLETGSTTINGPHQGAITDTPEGEWWFFHFQERPELGRVVHLQPMTWEDGWPCIGVDYDGNGVGEPVAEWKKPIAGNPRHTPRTSDSFDNAKLGLQWQANHRYVRENISFDRKKGWLSLSASRGDSLRNAPNTLTQKMTGEHGRATVSLDFSDMRESQKAGLACLAKRQRGFGVVIRSGKPVLYIEDGGNEIVIGPLESGEVCLRVDLDAAANSHRFSYSTDGVTFHEAWMPFGMIWGAWKGPRIGIYSYSPADYSGEGTAHFDNFVYEFD